jgi:amino acid adenylation domain-containing protein
VGRARRGGALLASFAQERLWFFDQLQPGTGQYNIPLTWHVCGPLDVDALGRSLNEVVRRHEALRTTFVSEGGPLLQVIADELYLPLTVTDLSSAADAHARALTLVEEEAELPFDLTRGPLVRTLLVRLAPDEHVLSVTLHHIISDGWSLDVLARELSALYGAFTEGKSSPLLELPVQYADYAVWQRGWLEGEVFDRQLSYWRRYLEGAPRALELPTDRALREMARRARVTTFMALAAGFGALLHRLSGQAEVCVGYPVANRARPEVEYLIGLFVNTLVLRTRVSDELTFEGLLGQVRESVLDADSHQDLPFEKLVEELHEERDASRHPLFQVLFTYQNLARSELHLPRLDVNPEPPAHRTSKFDLSLAVTEGEGGELSAAFEYSSDLFDRETVERLAGHLRTLLGAAASDPGRRVSELPLLGEDERRRILSEWNETAAEFPASVCLHELFEQRAEASGDSVAVVYDGRPMSYAELDGRANRLAHHLRGLGVGPEDRVGVMLERNTELLVALLAVLKAGGAYVPLDGQYPAERLQYMAEDAGLKVLLTETGLAGRIEPGATAVVDVLRDAEVIAAQNAAPVASGVRAENLAYVIYTSGSSGRPKGVQVSHQAVVNFLHAMREQPGITAQDVMLAVTTLSFDIAVLEIYLPLMVGARVVIVDRAVATDGELLAQLIAESGATLMQATPATWRLLFESRWKGEPSLKMLYGGEAMPREVLSKLLDLGSSPWNLYGPTETTVWVTAFLVEDIEGASIIGRPISNIQAYILDKHLQPVPVGVAGELFFAGAGLARGYLGQPAMTAERFIPHPFSTRPGARLYWTGDLARYRPGGEIEFLGRVDHQVKIRGYRIELGEIEAVLSRHAGVTQAVVTAREEGGGEKRLVAYVVATDGQTPTVGELRRHLQEQLPDYMLPNAFVFLAELPLTNNGKVDRRALPAPGAARPESDGGYVAPRTAAEGLLCGVWSEVLGVERVGVHDNFFALGGHSLLAARVAARLGRELRGRVSLRDFFTSPTVAEMARLAAARRGGGPGPVGRARRGGALLASFAQERLWFFDQLQPGTGVFNAPGAWLIKGPLDVAALERSLNEVVRRHETLRTTFIADNGLPLQVIAEHSHTPLPVIDLSGHPDAEGRARALLQEEAELPFDLARGPLIRAFLVRLAPDEHVLSVTLHHIISDGWSLSVLASELRDLYTAFAAGQQSPLAELPVQYADYAVWQRGWLEGEVFDRQLSYWRRYLEGAPRALELPTDRARPAALSHRGGWFEFGLGAELSAALREMARRARVTTFMALAAGFGALLHRLSGQAEVCVGYPVANRARPEVEYLIGLFVNILVMRTRVQPGETFEGLLGQVRESVLDADSHQDLPFDRLVEELRPERDPSRHPLIQVVISYLPQDELRLAGLELTPLQLEERTAKFDLTLFISETGAEIDAAFEYSSDLFDRETIERLASHLRTLLAAAASDPSRKVSGLPLLNEDERRRILSDWNDTSAESLWSLTKT